MAGPTSLALALLAVLALVVLTRILGFNQLGSIMGPDHAVLLAQNLPGGFAPADIAITRDGSGALLCDKAGRIAVIAANGAHFVVRAPGPGWHVRAAADGRLAISGSGLAAEFDLGDDRDRWLARLAGQPLAAD